MKRKEALNLMSAGALGLGLTPAAVASGTTKPVALKGNINHSACRWCYNDIPLEKLCEHAQEIGLVGLDIIGPKDWKTLLDRDLKVTLGNPDEFSLTDGFNDPANHASLQATYKDVITRAADAGVENIIVFSGNKRQLTDAEGIENCARGLDPLVKHAEEAGVLLVMELLNSKVDHEDYQCDKTPWGVELCEKMGSPNFKLLYDIYHMQIMEGDIIRTIQDNNHYFGHYHTGGVPGRNEIDESQELFYPAIMRAIVETGYKGYVAQEFIPTTELKVDSLKEAVQLCDV